MPDEGANLIDEDKASNGVAATLFRSLIHCSANTHAASGLHTSGMTQLKKPCQSEAVRQDWRGDLEQSDARGGVGSGNITRVRKAYAFQVKGL
jgi:hypothetical protein